MAFKKKEKTVQSNSQSCSAVSGDKFNFGKISGLIDNLSKKSSIIIEDSIKEKKYISTGVYILDAMLSKSVLHGGISSNRITVFAGPKATGKSFIALNICRNAQKLGYNIIYLDTEYALELSDFEMYGIDSSDPNKFKFLRSNLIEKIKFFFAQLLEEIKNFKDKGVDVSNTLLVIDSLANLGSEKEVSDAQKGENKQDMTRAKALASLFRIITSDLGYLGIATFITNHIYMTMDLFPQEKLKGGEALNYAASTIVYLSDAKLKTGEEDDMDLQSGSVITAKSRKNRVAKPKKVKFDINYEYGINPYRGLELFCTPENFNKVGIAQVKEVVDKKTGEITYEKSSTRYFVKHLGKSFYEKQIFNGKVFTKQVLESLEPIVQEYFRYSSYDEYRKLLDDMNEQYSEFEGEEGLVDIDVDDEKLFK